MAASAFEAGDFARDPPSSVEADIYLKTCEENHSPIQNNVLQALSTASVTGELCLSGHTLGSAAVAGLAAALRLSCQILVLNLADCMVGPPALGGLLEALTAGRLRSLNLHGNNLGSQISAKLGRLLAANQSIKTLNLKWNNLGLSPDSFAIFCNGLSQNSTLEELDLRSNQLCMECAKHLASAIRVNKTLRSLDIRWNNIQNEGAESLLRGLDENHSLFNLQLQGNSVHREIALAIDECIKNHAKIVKTNSDHETKINILLERIIVLEESRTQQLNEFREHRVAQMGETEKRLETLSLDNQEKQKRIEELESQLLIIEEEYKIVRHRNSNLEENLKDRERSHKEFQIMQQRSLDKLRKEVKEEEEDLRTKMQLSEDKAQKNQKTLEESQQQLLLRNKENSALKEELSHLKARYENDLKQMTDTFEADRKTWKNKMDEMVRVHEDQIQRLRSAAFDTQQRLEAIITELTEKQSGKFLGLSERYEQLKLEKVSLEDRLSSMQSTISQLQRENSNLIAQVAEPARKLTALLDELSNEKLENQKLKQEKMERTANQEELTKELANVKSKFSAMKSMEQQSENKHQEELKAMKVKIKQLQSKLDNKKQKIEEMKSEEKARNKFLQSAFSKYFGKYHPPQSPSSKSSGDS